MWKNLVFYRQKPSLPRYIYKYGLIDDNVLVEIKYPSSAKDMSPGEAIKKRKVTF